MGNHWLSLQICKVYPFESQQISGTTTGNLAQSVFSGSESDFSHMSSMCPLTHTQTHH